MINTNTYQMNYQQYISIDTTLNTTNKEVEKVEQKSKIFVNSVNEAVSEFEGYGVDKDGYFTDDFNAAAGIPNDYKIHKDSMESLLNANYNAVSLNKVFVSIDIAATVGNAYKILSQVAPEVANSTQSDFSRAEIAAMPQGYEYSRTSLSVEKVYSNIYDYHSADLTYNYNQHKKSLATLFYNPDGVYHNKVATDIFNNPANGKENSNTLSMDSHGEKYTDKITNNITKGGLLVAIINSNNRDVIKGEYSLQAQLDWGEAINPNLNHSEIAALKRQTSTLSIPDNVSLNGNSMIDYWAILANTSDIKTFATYTNKVQKIFNSMPKTSSVGDFQNVINDIIKEINEKRKKKDEEEKAKRKKINISA